MDASKLKRLLRDGSAQELNDYGAVYLQNRAFDKAIKLYSKALTLAKIQLGEKHPEVGKIYSNLSITWYWRNLASRDFDKATEFTTKALAILLPTLGESHSVTGACYDTIAKIEKAKGNDDNAIQFYTKALVISRACGTPEMHANTAAIYHQLGETYVHKKAFAQAIEYQAKALAIRQAVLGENHPDTAECYSKLGCVYYHKFVEFSCSCDLDCDKAIEFLTKAVTVRRATVGEMHPDAAHAYNELATAYAGKSDFRMAASLAEKAVGISEATDGPKHILTVMYRQCYTEFRRFIKFREFAESEHGVPEPPSKVRLQCDNCGGSGDMLLCSRCLVKRYCGPSCQRQHWPVHKASCKPCQPGPNPGAAVP